MARFLEQELPEPTEKIGVTNLIEHVRDVGPHPAIKQRYYMVSPKVLKEVNKELDEMIKDGVVDKSKSDWSSPIIMIKKPDGTYRVCLEFRKVNSVTKKDEYPLPQIDSILHKFRHVRYISKLDMQKGFLQIPLHLNSREKTTFTVPGRGLSNFGECLWA